MRTFRNVVKLSLIVMCALCASAISAYAATYNHSTNTTTITDANSVSCNTGAAMGFRHTDNSYYRVYTPSDFGATGNVAIQSVRFGVEQSTPTGANQPVTIRLYTSSNGLITGTLTEIASSTVNVPAGDLFFQIANINGPSLPATTPVIVELFTPDGRTIGNTFFIGSNALGQSGPSYIKAADCGIATPTNVAAIGFPDMHIHLAIFTTPATTAAGTSVSGRVLTGPGGRGLTNAIVSLTDQRGSTRTTVTARSGGFRFEDVEPGSNYVISVVSRRFRFAPKSINVTDNLTGVDLVPDE